MTGTDLQPPEPANLDELAAQIVDALERARTTSANVLRDRAYRLLSKLGLDVAALVGHSRKGYEKDLRLRAKRSSRRRENLKLRIEKMREDKVPEDKIVAAMNALRRAPKNYAAHKRALQQVMSRPPVWPTEPTPERRRWAPEPATVDVIVPGQGPVKPTVAHRFDWPINQISDLLTEGEYEAADNYYFAYYGCAPGPRIGNYDGGGSQSDPAKRLPLTPSQQRAGRELAMWRRKIPRVLEPIIENFVLGIPPRGALASVARRNAIGLAVRSGMNEREAAIAGEQAARAVLETTGPEKPFSRSEFGKIYGRCKGDHQARGVADGAIKLACGILAAIWADYQEELDRQRDEIRRASENANIRALIARGALAEAAREIQEETRTRAAAAAKGVPAPFARSVLDALSYRGKPVGKPRERHGRSN